MAQYGKLGLNVGVVGRWLRLVYGSLLLVPIAIGLAEGFSGASSLAFYGETALYFVGIVVAYSVVYLLLGERFLSRLNPWVNTLIFVGPALIAWWNVTLALPTGIELPSSLTLAMAIYIGVSLLLEWKIRYGGCEVVSLPIILFKRRYVTYCVPMVAVDAAEKRFVDADSGTGKLIWGGLSAAVLLVILGWTVTALM